MPSQTLSDKLKKVYEDIDSWRTRPLESEYPYVFMDGVWHKRSWGGRVENVSVLVVIGVGELTRQGQEIIAVNFRAFEVWLTVAIFYLAMTLSISAVLRYYERKLMIGRRAVPASPSDPQM